MSVNIFQNGVLQKIAGAIGNAVPLINNFLTNQPGQGAADANTVYQLKNELDSLGGFTPIMDESGKITGYTTKIGGADTVFPFKSEPEIVASIEKSALQTDVTSSITYTATDDEENLLVIVFRGSNQRYPVAGGYTKITINDEEIYNSSAYPAKYRESIKLNKGDVLAVNLRNFYQTSCSNTHCCYVIKY